MRFGAIFKVGSSNLFLLLPTLNISEKPTGTSPFRVSDDLKTVLYFLIWRFYQINLEFEISFTSYKLST